MDKEEIVRRLKRLAEHSVHVVGEPPFIMSLDDGIALGEAVSLLKEQVAREQCLKTKCVICPHCDHCDVDENGQLKEQEIKSMTLEELDEIYEKQDTHIWPFDTPPYLWMTVNPDVRLTDGFWICWRDVMYSIKNDSPFYVRENYGKAWLIWTGKPTQEQVQAVKWDEDQ